MDAWYTLHTKPQSEVQVHRALMARGFESYLPMLPPRKDRHAQPLFPAYLFVRCDMEAIGIGSLQWIPGLRRILAFAGRPAIVPDEAISLIHAKMAEIDADGGLPRHHFKAGDPVVIERGATQWHAWHFPRADRARRSECRSSSVSWARRTAPKWQSMTWRRLLTATPR